MTFRKYFVTVCFLMVLVTWFACPSHSFGYCFPLVWSDYSNANYGRGHYVATKIFLAVCNGRGVTLSETGETLLSGFTGNLSATYNGHTIAFNPPYSNDHISKYVVVWPIYQDGNIVRVAYQMLITGFVRGTSVPGTEGTKHRFIWCDVGTADITNFFTTVDQVQIVNHNNEFPMTLGENSGLPVLSWMVPSVKTFTINYDSFVSNLLAGQRLQNGSIRELVYAWVECSYIFQTGNYQNGYTFDFYTWQNVSLDNAPGAFNLFNNLSVYNQFTISNILAVDTDAGSEPDLHEFYNVHLYTYPEDDWVYSGEDYPSGGGSGTGGEVTSYGPQAQQTMTETTETALENYFGSDDTVTTPQMPTESFDEDLDDIATDDDFLTTAKDEIEDDLIDAAPGIPKFKRIINALKTPGSGRLPVWDLSLESNVLPNMSIFHGAQAQVDLNVLLQSPYKSWMEILRKVVVFLMFGNLVIYIITDFFGIGKAGDAE